MSACLTTADTAVACSAASPTPRDRDRSEAAIEPSCALLGDLAVGDLDGAAEQVPLSLLEAVREHIASSVGGPSIDLPLDPSLSSMALDAPSGASLTIGVDTSDEHLARAACGGDPRAAITIFRRYVTQVRSKLLRWIGGHDLDDHVQEVFSRLFEQLPRLRQASALRSFLIGITLRVACTELRRRRRWRLRLTATGEVPDIAEPGRDDGTAREALSRFEDILDKLAPRTRRVFVLRHVEKLELVDVAAAMDISLATAKRHLARASTRVFAMAEREPALVDYVREMRPRGSPAAAVAAAAS